MASRAVYRARSATGRATGVTGIVTRYADPMQMAEWLDGARTGAVLIYASGPNLNGGRHPAAVLARRWNDAGQAALFSKRYGEGFQFCAKKLSAACAGEARLPADWQASVEAEVYRLLEDCAARGVPCPSNEAIAEALELRDRYAARYRFDQLVKQGMVRVITSDRLTGRVIEITASGARTRSIVQKSGALS